MPKISPAAKSTRPPGVASTISVMVLITGAFAEWLTRSVLHCNCGAMEVSYPARSTSARTGSQWLALSRTAVSRPNGPASRLSSAGSSYSFIVAVRIIAYPDSGRSSSATRQGKRHLAALRWASFILRRATAPASAAYRTAVNAVRHGHYKTGGLLSRATAVPIRSVSRRTDAASSRRSCP